MFAWEFLRWPTTSNRGSERFVFPWESSFHINFFALTLTPSSSLFTDPKSLDRESVGGACSPVDKFEYGSRNGPANFSSVSRVKSGTMSFMIFHSYPKLTTVQKKKLNLSSFSQGAWKIKVEKKKSLPQLIHTTTFEVRKYVLPRFQVTINSPRYILADAHNVTWTVCASYSYGKPVRGTLLLKSSPQTPSWRRKLNLPEIHNEVQVSVFSFWNNRTIKYSLIFVRHVESFKIEIQTASDC